MGPAIREAVADDWPGVAAVLAELGRPDARGEPEEQRHQAIFVSYLERDDVDAFVAEENNDILGFVNVEYRARLKMDPPQGWIAELVVSERRRRAGIGKQLLARAEEAARERGCWASCSSPRRGGTMHIDSTSARAGTTERRRSSRISWTRWNRDT
jgi:GNAT superfamily N-acetyltransferase